LHGDVQLMVIGKVFKPNPNKVLALMKGEWGKVYLVGSGFLSRWYD